MGFVETLFQCNDILIPQNKILSVVTYLLAILLNNRELKIR